MNVFFNFCGFILAALLLSGIYAGCFLLVVDIIAHTRNAYSKKSSNDQKGLLNSDKNKKDK